MKLVIGNKNYSSWSLRPWLLLSVHGIPFEEERIALDLPDTRDRIARYNDAGKVPVLLDGDLTIWDSLAICEYVSERYLDGRGWPGELAARAQARAVSAEMHSGFTEIRGRLPMNCRATARRVPIDATLQREIGRVEGIWSDCLARYSSDGPWLFGDFTIADCMFAPVAFRFHTYGIGLSAPAAAYSQRLLGIDAMQQWLADAQAEGEVIDDEEVGLAGC